VEDHQRVKLADVFTIDHNVIQDRPANRYFRLFYFEFPQQLAGC